MSQHHKLICGGLSVFFAATHVGCAGSGLKNIFTRNETDGYHSLDELAVEERTVAEAEESGSEEKAPSMADRLASWRPFAKAEPEEEDDYADGEALASADDSEEPATSPRFLGRAFLKQDAVEPDPFLGTEPERSDRPESPVSKTVADQKTAKIDNKPTEMDDESSPGPDPIPEDSKDGDADSVAVALGASRESSPSSSEDDDNALAKRFEQHFLLNSVGTMAKTETEPAAAGKDLLQKAATSATMAESIKRDRSTIADRQIEEFDYRLADDPGHNEKNAGFQRNSEATPLKISKRNDLTSEKSESSLYAFDQLMGAEGGAAKRDTAQVTRKVTQSPNQNAAALDINVADAEALFGAAAARQNARSQQAEDAPRSESSGHDVARSSGWSQTPGNSDRFQWNESTQGKSESEADRNRGDVSSAFARHAQGNSVAGKQRPHDMAFGVPAASAGDVDSEARSLVETADICLSNASASATGHRIVTANYGTAYPHAVTHPVSTETPAAGDAHFTAAPVAPVSRLESNNEVAAAASRPGLVQSLSTRNWLLLIGGIIVIALLFAPGRTKPLTMNGRPVNG